ncbi:MAG TPA: O-antigen ligase family protein [Thermoanaerobaculia bacterium]|nr:O-antigen ligase family protein [Thermoanaerobaculia bacterium]
MTALAVAFTRERAEREPFSRRQRAILTCVAAALCLAIASALASPHRDIALDGVRTMLLMAVLPVLCAIVPNAWQAVTTGYLVGAGVNAIVAIAQGFGVETFDYITQPLPGRTNVSALIGNTGLLGLVIAFAALILADRLDLRRPRTWIALAAIVIGLLAIGSKTPVAVLACGIMARIGARRLLLSTAVLFFLFAANGKTLREEIDDRLLSYRLGAWKAAAMMAGERPLLGFGPNTYAAEYARHADPELANPALVGSYAEAHNDWLQAAAEIGIPAAALLLVASVLLIRNARDPLVVSMLVAGAVSALSWFPLQRPETAIVLLAACGHAWRQR